MSGRRDLNSRPYAPKAYVLPSELRPVSFAYCIILNRYNLRYEPIQTVHTATTHNVVAHRNGIHH